jgi:hypothetical protein
MNPTLYLCREMPDITTVWKVVWEKLLSNQLLKVCIAFLRMKRLTSPDTEIGWDSSKPRILFRLSNFCLRSCMSISFTCTVVLLTYIPAFCMAMRAKGRNVKCPNHRGICTANLDRTDVIGNESRSAERCAHKIAQDDPLKILPVLCPVLSC